MKTIILNQNSTIIVVISLIWLLHLNEKLLSQEYVKQNDTKNNNLYLVATTSKDRKISTINNINTTFKTPKISNDNFKNKNYQFGGIKTKTPRKFLAPGEAPEEYIVQPGDTLYDICDQLLDYPDYWPKLWALNPHIKNPHFIEPGTVIRFYPGNIEVPPSLNVVYEDDIISTVAENPKEITEKKRLVQVDLSKIIMDKIAYKQPEFIDISDLPQEEIKEEYDIVGQIYDVNTQIITLPTILYYSKPQPLGQVIGGILGETSASEGTSIVIEKFGQFNLGAIYTILRPAGQLKSSNKFVGYRYEFVAHIKITDTTENPDYNIAQVVYSRLAAQPEDLVFSYTSMQRKLVTKPFDNIQSDPQASVVGFTYPTQLIGTQGDFVIIDKSYVPGTIFPIYQTIATRGTLRFIDSLPNLNQNIGYIQIIETKENYSIGVILSNIIDVHIGDVLGSTKKG